VLNSYEKRSKKERKWPMETDAPMEIRKKRGFPQELGKAVGFSTVPTGPTTRLLREFHSNDRGWDPP